MNTILKYIAALFVSGLIPALVIVFPYAYGSLSAGDGFGWVRTMNFSLSALTISFGHVLILGTPTFILLKLKNAIYWWSSILVGFILGCIPIGIWSWPLRFPELKSSASHWDGKKMVHTMIDGVPTMTGWLSYINGVAFMGLFGAIGGLAFWLVWRKISPNPTLKRDCAKARSPLASR